MTTFTELRALFASAPDDPAQAWQRAAALFATFTEERANGVLADELQSEHHAGLEEKLIGDIREALAKADMSAFDYVIFRTEDWDNGSFLSRYAEIVIDGESERFDFPYAVEETMTERYGCVGDCAGLGFHNRTDTLEFDDYADNLRDTMRG